MAEHPLLCKPPDRTIYVGNVMTNLDHTIDPLVHAELALPGTFGSYTAWDFYGQSLWMEGGQYHCEIWRHHAHVDTITADTLEELMAEACDAWGDA